MVTDHTETKWTVKFGYSIGVAGQLASQRHCLNLVIMRASQRYLSIHSHHAHIELCN